MPESFQLTRFATEKEWREYAGAYIGMLLRDQGKDSISIAVAGGSTPYPVYEQLTRLSDIPWSAVSLYQTDERYVAAESPNSNQAELRETWASVSEHLKAVELFDTSLDWEESADEYAERLKNVGDGFDVAVLGIGSDGHFASLFPQGPYWDFEIDSRVIISEAPEGMDVTERLSVAPHMILNSTYIVVLLRGERKSSVMGELARGEQSVNEFPARFLLSHPRVSIWWSQT